MYIHLIIECDRRGNENINIGKVVAAYDNESEAHQAIHGFRTSDKHYYYGIDAIYINTTSCASDE